MVVMMIRNTLGSMEMVNMFVICFTSFSAVSSGFFLGTLNLNF